MFSLLLTVILVGIGIGCWPEARPARRTGMPAVWFIVAQASFVVSTLDGLRDRGRPGDRRGGEPAGRFGDSTRCKHGRPVGGVLVQRDPDAHRGCRTRPAHGL